MLGSLCRRLRTRVSRRTTRRMRSHRLGLTPTGLESRVYLSHVFDFEGLTPTAFPRLGALTSLTMVSSDVTATITRSGGSFDLMLNEGDQAKPPEFGRISLDTFADEYDDRPIVVNFSVPITSFSVSVGDYGEDPDDLIVIQAFQDIDGRGPMRGSDSAILPTIGELVFNSRRLSISSPEGFRSVVMIGGTVEFPHSVFYDQIEITPLATGMPDLAITGAQLVESGHVRFQYEVIGNPGPFPVALIASQDGVFSPDDVAIGYVPVFPEPDSRGEAEIALPFEVRSGSTLFVVADPDPGGAPQGIIEESNEENNVASVSLPTVGFRASLHQTVLAQPVLYDVTTPDFPFADPVFGIEVKQQADQDWTIVAGSPDGYRLGIVPRVAGHFEVRAFIVHSGVKYLSSVPEKLPLEVTFPNVDAILAGIGTTMLAMGQAGIDYSRSFPNIQREIGFTVLFDSRTGIFHTGPVAAGDSPVRQERNHASVRVFVPHEASESKFTDYFNIGSEYVVAIFHSHPARNQYRLPSPTGASGTDLERANNGVRPGLIVPELIYDYIPTGEIWDNSSQGSVLYADYGTRRFQIIRSLLGPGTAGVRARLSFDRPAVIYRYGVDQRETPR